MLKEREAKARDSSAKSKQPKKVSKAFSALASNKMVKSDKQMLRPDVDDARSKVSSGILIEQEATKIFKVPPHLPQNASDFRIFVFEVIESKGFRGSILFVILLNTAILVAQTNERVAMKGGKHQWSLHIENRI